MAWLQWEALLIQFWKENSFTPGSGAAFGPKGSSELSPSVVADSTDSVKLCCLDEDEVGGTYGIAFSPVIHGNVGLGRVGRLAVGAMGLATNFAETEGSLVGFDVGFFVGRVPGTSGGQDDFQVE